jgi:hypothetical protein
MHGQARLPELSALGYFRQRSRHARDPLSFSEVSLTASSRMPPLRGKGDSPVGSVCSFLASTRAATVSSSARCRTHGVNGEMRVRERTQV